MENNNVNPCSEAEKQNEKFKAIKEATIKARYSQLFDFFIPSLLPDDDILSCENANNPPLFQLRGTMSLGLYLHIPVRQELLFYQSGE